MFAPSSDPIQLPATHLTFDHTVSAVPRIRSGWHYVVAQHRSQSSGSNVKVRVTDSGNTSHRIILRKLDGMNWHSLRYAAAQAQCPKSFTRTAAINANEVVCGQE